jgi:hypothetical protein
MKLICMMSNNIGFASNNFSATTITETISYVDIVRPMIYIDVTIATGLQRLAQLICNHRPAR